MIGAKIENWDAKFQEHWESADLVDCVLSYAATELVAAAVKQGAAFTTKFSKDFIQLFLLT